jgi:hypothetical protein
MYKELKTAPCIFTMESSFAGVDIGKDNGVHLSTLMLENLGRDLCRTLLIHQSIYIPPELEGLFKLKKTQAATSASFAASINDIIMQELAEKKDLLRMGDGDSSSGSDSAPSDDNLDAAELIKNLPTVDKTLKKKLKQENDRRNDLKKLIPGGNKALLSKKTIPPILPEPQKRLASP